MLDLLHCQTTTCNTFVSSFSLLMQPQDIQKNVLKSVINSLLQDIKRYIYETLVNSGVKFQIFQLPLSWNKNYQNIEF